MRTTMTPAVTARPDAPAAKHRGQGLFALACGAVAVLLVLATGIWLLARSATAAPLTVAGAFGEPPRVTFPEGEPPGTEPTTETVIAGRGARAAQGDLAVVEFASYAWSGTSRRALDDSHKQGRSAVMRIGELIPGLNRALIGKSVGSRVLATIPPQDGYGPGGDEQAGVGATDTLVYVVDLLAVYPKTAAARGRALPPGPALPRVTGGSPPAVTIPSSKPPGELRVATLIEGDGAAVRADQMVITHYQGQIWRDGKVFDSSWARGEVAPMSSLSGTIPGVREGLAGQKAGSRVLLVVPPKDGYGDQAPHTAVKPGDTLVFVFDILGAH